MKTTILAALLLASPAMAENLDCKLSEMGAAGNYFGANVLFQVDRKAGTVRARDGVIVNVAKKEDIAAQVVEMNDNRFVAKWSIDMTNSNVQTTRMVYRATYRWAEKTVIIRAMPTGYDNEFTAKGTCKVN